MKRLLPMLMALLACSAGVTVVNSQPECCIGASAEVLRGDRRLCVFLGLDGTYCTAVYTAEESCNQVDADWTSRCGGRP